MMDSSGCRRAGLFNWFWCSSSKQSSFATQPASSLLEAFFIELIFLPGLHKWRRVKKAWVKERTIQFSCFWLTKKRKTEGGKLKRREQTWLLFLLHSFLHQEFAEVLAGGFYYWLAFLLTWEGQGSLFGPCVAWNSTAGESNPQPESNHNTLKPPLMP